MKYVLSDIHGNLDNWKSIMEQIKLTSDDELYVLGDVIDRYPYGIQILQEIMSKDNIHMLLGNHEHMMLDALGFPYDQKMPNIPKTDPRDSQEKRALWYMNGGDVTHRAFTKLSSDEQRELIDYLLSLPLNIAVEIEDRLYRLCHATIEEMYDLVELREGESKASFCTWDRETIMLLADIEGAKIVFGHTPTFNFQPEKNPLEVLRYGNLIGIDCGSGWPNTSKSFQCEGRLACLRLDDEAEFYSN